MSLFDIYKAEKLGAGAGSLFDAKAGGKLNNDAWKKGFNKWDEQWALGGIVNKTGQNYSASDRIRGKNYCPCLPSTNYYANTDITIYFYDEEQAYIGYDGTLVSGSSVTSPSNAYYFRIVKQGVTSYDNNICVNVSGEHNGEYVPYDGE